MSLLTALLSPNHSLACWRVGGKLSAYADGVLSNAERRGVSVHLRECRACGSRHEELMRTRSALKRLPPVAPPDELNTKLQELAVQEALFRQNVLRGESAMQFSWDSLKVRASNAMRPLAIPFAGGLVSALVLFSMLVPAYPGAARFTANDVPTSFHQEPTVKSVAPFALSDDDLEVEITVDDQGHVIDYSLPQGKVSAELRREIENSLLFTRFTPAMSFGQPTTGRIRLSFRRSYIDVKG